MMTSSRTTVSSATLGAFVSQRRRQASHSPRPAITDETILALCKSVRVAVASASGLPPVARNMLAAGVEMSLGVDPSSRDHRQAVVVGLIAEALRNIERGLEADLEVAEGAMAAEAVLNGAKRTQLRQAACLRQEDARKSIDAAHAVLAEELAQLDAATQRAIDAQVWAEVAETARCACDGDLLAADLEREVCLRGCALLCEEGSTSLNTDAAAFSQLQKVCTQLGLEDSLVLLLPVVACKALSERTGLDKAAAKMLHSALSARLSALQLKVDGGAEARAPLVAKAEEAHARLADAEEQRLAATITLGEAQAELSRQLMLRKLADAEVLKVDQEIRSVCAPVDKAREQLRGFREGAMAAFVALGGGSLPSIQATKEQATIRAESGAPPFGQFVATEKPDIKGALEIELPIADSQGTELEDSSRRETAETEASQLDSPVGPDVETEAIVEDDIYDGRVREVAEIVPAEVTAKAADAGPAAEGEDADLEESAGVKRSGSEKSRGEEVALAKAARLCDEFRGDEKFCDGVLARRHELAEGASDAKEWLHDRNINCAMRAADSISNDIASGAARRRDANMEALIVSNVSGSENSRVEEDLCAEAASLSDELSCKGMFYDAPCSTAAELDQGDTAADPAGGDHPDVAESQGLKRSASGELRGQEISLVEGARLCDESTLDRIVFDMCPSLAHEATEEALDVKVRLHGAEGNCVAKAADSNLEDTACDSAEADMVVLTELARSRLEDLRVAESSLASEKRLCDASSLVGKFCDESPPLVQDADGRDLGIEEQPQDPETEKATKTADGNCDGTASDAAQGEETDKEASRGYKRSEGEDLKVEEVALQEAPRLRELWPLSDKLCGVRSLLAHDLSVKVFEERMWDIEIDAPDAPRLIADMTIGDTADDAGECDDADMEASRAYEESRGEEASVPTLARLCDGFSLGEKCDKASTIKDDAKIKVVWEGGTDRCSDEPAATAAGCASAGVGASRGSELSGSGDLKGGEASGPTRSKSCDAFQLDGMVFETSHLDSDVKQFLCGAGTEGATKDAGITSDDTCNVVVEGECRDIETSSGFQRSRSEDYKHEEASSARAAAVSGEFPSNSKLSDASPYPTLENVEEVSDPQECLYAEKSNLVHGAERNSEDPASAVTDCEGADVIVTRGLKREGSEDFRGEGTTLSKAPRLSDAFPCERKSCCASPSPVHEDLNEAASVNKCLCDDEVEYAAKRADRKSNDIACAAAEGENAGIERARGSKRPGSDDLGSQDIQPTKAARLCDECPLVGKFCDASAALARDADEKATEVRERSYGGECTGATGGADKYSEDSISKGEDRRDFDTDASPEIRGFGSENFAGQETSSENGVQHCDKFLMDEEFCNVSPPRPEGTGDSTLDSNVQMHDSGANWTSKSAEGKSDGATGDAAGGEDVDVEASRGLQRSASIDFRGEEASSAKLGRPFDTNHIDGKLCDASRSPRSLFGFVRQRMAFAMSRALPSAGVGAACHDEVSCRQVNAFHQASSPARDRAPYAELGGS